MVDFHDVENIYCIGRNYAKHAKELGNEVPSSPVIFSKPTHALHSAEGELELPFQLGDIHHELELVIKMASTFNPNQSLDKVIDGIALGIDWTARDLQTKLKEKGQPWLLAKGFKGSAVLTEFLPVPNESDIPHLSYSLVKNGDVVQEGEPGQMIFSIRELLEYIDTHLGLHKGDVIFTGTPEGVGPIQSGDVMELKLYHPHTDSSYTFGPLTITSMKST
ncbi:FAA hydrolase family protein [Pontibacillus yanchengensis]|uniref:FAA hydrolase family protein n=2 Tax=Pontibacillus yanchengensis TaxID=462910 RepID=A0ACC7VGT2_9BACI|nr:fumarylacetoacetate hydrolase family protein [Pontibacillus yanchengensis]MYL34051.1 FAA hydrolase family protein [Pontibacillus yanchengensis]MYL53139.1 FAA hydrolase family protein [Pontibacillus yanchengensis]